MWRDELIERSWRVLNDLKTFVDFVVIGGWGVYFWTKKLKSRDIDLYVSQEAFYKLQMELQQRGYPLKRNVRLQKFEALIGDVEVDLYTPFMCNLVIPCSEVLHEKLYSIVEGFNVATPEVLLILKAQAARQRWHAEKGVKDRADIISLLQFADIKTDTLRSLLDSYDKKHILLDVIRRAVTESRIEYRVLGLTYERDGAQLRQFLKETFP